MAGNSRCGYQPLVVVRGTGVCPLPASSGHCGLMPANLITLAHFSVSSAMNLVNSPGEVENDMAPRSASRALILGSMRAALTSLLRRSTISAGVALGAAKPTPATRREVRHGFGHRRDIR